MRVYMHVHVFAQMYMVAFALVVVGCLPWHHWPLPITSLLAIGLFLPNIHKRNMVSVYAVWRPLPSRFPWAIALAILAIARPLVLTAAYSPFLYNHMTASIKPGTWVLY